jgi:hypothetical protein
MKVFIDGKELKNKTDVLVVFESFDPDHTEYDLHVKLTPEGMIQEVMRDGESVDSHAEEVLDIAEKFRNEDACDESDS